MVTTSCVSAVVLARLAFVLALCSIPLGKKAPTAALSSQVFGRAAGVLATVLTGDSSVTGSSSLVIGRRSAVLRFGSAA